MKRTIRIALVDMWEGCPISFVARYFADEYEVVVDTANPDIVFFSCFGLEHLKYDKAIKIFINGESLIPDFNDCDYCIGTIKYNFMERAFWIPLSHWAADANNLPVAPISREAALNRKFCSFIYSQDSIGKGAKDRKEFCMKLMQYKHVDCPGRILHNCNPGILSDRWSDNWITSKRTYCSGFKFAIAYENHNLPGYMTEKLTDCYMSNTIPIYCGSKGDVAPYPKDSMICIDDFASMDEAIDKVREIDEDDDAYMSMLNANPFRNAEFDNGFTQGVQEFVRKIIEEGSPLFDDVRDWSASHYCKRFIQAENDPYFRKCRQVIEKLRKMKAQLRQVFKQG